MINSSEYLKYSIIAYVIISIYIWIKKPSLLFDNQQNIKQFGIGYNKTIFYYPFLIIILAIILYSIFYSFHLRKSLQ
jgi:hypothetical protein